MDGHMTAVVKDREGAGFSLAKVRVPAPASDGLLIEVKAVGICGTDVSIFNGKRQVPIPLIPGHEFAGVVVQSGPGAAGFRPGDRVTAGLVIGCGECAYCRADTECLCDDIEEIGIHVDGAFAKYVRAPAKVVHHLPVGMSLEDGASIDPVASAYRAVKKAEVRPGDVVVVFGPGPIGLYALQVALSMGAQQVVSVGVQGDEGRLEVAKALGAAFAVLGKGQEVVRAVEGITGGRMADVVVEATGRQGVMDTCVRCLKKSGRMGVAGIFHEPSPVDMGLVVRRELVIKGSICYTRDDFEKSMDLVNSGQVKTAPIITHRLGLEDLAQGLEFLDRKEAIKVMLYP